MDNKIQRCAKAFEHLLNYQYKMILGRKGKTVEILLTFSETEFVHLAGLHKLVDYDFLRTASRSKVFEAALSGKLSYQKLEKSPNFEFVKERVEYFEFLEDMLDRNDVIFKYNEKKNIFSLIHADYLLQSQHNSRDIYIFIDKLEESNTHFCRSFFPKGDMDYTVGQTKYTLLYKEKINKKTGESVIQYNRLNK